MKKKILKYIEENNGKTLVDIYDEFKGSFYTGCLMFITELEQENKIELITGLGYCKLN